MANFRGLAISFPSATVHMLYAKKQYQMLSDFNGKFFTIFYLGFIDILTFKTKYNYLSIACAGIYCFLFEILP